MKIKYNSVMQIAVIIPLIWVLWFSVAIPDSWAISNEQLERQQLMLQQQQEQQRQREQQRQQLRQVERRRNSKLAPLGTAAAQEAVDSTTSDAEDTTKCSIFKDIRISGNTVYSTAYLNRHILNKYLNRCINKTNIYNIQNELTNLYIKHGYSTTRIYFDIQQLREGIFIVVVQEGKVNQVIMQEMDGDRPRPVTSKRQQARLQRQLKLAFPGLTGKIFYLPAIEQGIEQINRLASNQATTDIRPTTAADKFGYSDIIVINQKSHDLFISAGMDNSGSKSTGTNLANIAINKDNLFALNDNLYIKYTQDTTGETDVRYNRSLYTSLSVPLGYFTFSGNINYSEYLTTVNGFYTTFKTSGNTLTQSYAFDAPLFKRKSIRVNLGAQLEMRDTENFVRDVKSQTGSRKSSNINIYLNNTIYTHLGTIVIKPSFQQGLGLFGAKKDPPDLLDIEPKLQYSMWKLYAYYATRFGVPLLTKTTVKDEYGNEVMVDTTTSAKAKDGTVSNAQKPLAQTASTKAKDSTMSDTQKPLAQNDNTPKLQPIRVRNKITLNYTLTLDSQYSAEALYGTNQFSVGGEYTVRGFQEGNISGDIGYYLRNDLSVSLQQLVPRKALASKLMNAGGTKRRSLSDMLARTYISVFYDTGYVKNAHPILPDKYNSQSGYMSGAGVSLNYYGSKHLSWSLVYATALHAPQYLQTRDGIKKEAHSLYWRLNYKW